MSRRANIPVTILAIGIFVVCTIAVISFIVSQMHTRDTFSGVKLVEKVNSDAEKYFVHQNLGEVQTETLDSGKVVVYRELIDSSGFWFWKEERVVLRVEYPIS